MGCMKIGDFIKSKLEKNKYARPILSGLGMIALVTLISVISVHYLLGNTLADYAASNPDAAYGRDGVEAIPEQTGTVTDVSTVDSDTADAGITDTASADEPGTTAAGTSDTTSTDTPGNAIIDEPDTSETGTSNAANAGEADEASGLPEYNRSVMIHFYDPENDSAGRQTYKPGFYYEPLSQQVMDYITGVSYPGTDDMVITYDDLRYVGILYVDFNGLTQAGELICNSRIAQDMVEIFHELYISDYRFDSVYLIDNYGGDDTASMCADNTSCFNYRVVDGSSSLSKHAYGLAIDINPFYNPYIVFGKGENGSDYISPPGSEIYADRSASFPYKIDDSDLCYRLFISHGFKWGGDWNSCKDYQHFQKNP